MCLSSLRGRFEAVIVPVLTGALCVAGLPVGAQTLAPTPVFDSQRDPAAVRILQSALTAMGGQANWQGIHGARVVGTAISSVKGTSGPTTETTPITWVDDWSTGHPRYTRTSTDSSGQHTRKSDGSAAFTATFNSRSIIVPRHDATTVLLTHLPGAALLIELTSTDYGVQIMPPAKGQVDNGTTKVRVTKNDHRTIQEWTITNQTGAVRTVRFTIPDALHLSTPVWETATFVHFRSQNGVLVPDVSTTRQSTGRSVSYTFDSLELNPTVASSTFTEEGVR